MLLGHDAIGHGAIGHPISEAGTTFVLLADAGSFLLSGGNAVFEIDEICNKGTFILVGNDASFSTSFVSGTGSFIWNGFSMSFTTKMFLDRGAFIWTGYDVTFTFDKAFTFKRFITQDHLGGVYAVRTENIKRN
jgi:hypothetical protein